jgi:hypothetical protein
MDERLHVEEFMEKNNVKPMDISQERFDKIVEERFTYEVFVNNSQYEDVIFHFLNLDGKRNYAMIPNEDIGETEFIVVNPDYELYCIRLIDLVNVYLKNSEIFNKRLYTYSLKSNGGKKLTIEQLRKWMYKPDDE